MSGLDHRKRRIEILHTACIATLYAANCYAHGGRSRGELIAAFDSVNVLVTGGTGAIGAWVTRALIDLGHRPIVFSRSSSTRLLSDIDPADYEFVPGDVREAATLLGAVRDHSVSRIIHLTALLDDSQLDPRAAVDVNVLGTLNVLEAARGGGVDRVVYASSKRAIGPIEGPWAHPAYRPITEDHPCDPVLMYDVTKFACERIGYNYERVYGLMFFALRFAQTYMPGRSVRPDAGMLAIRSKIIENAMLGKAVRISSGGDGKDDCIYVRDVADGLVRACFAEDATHRLFHLGTGKGATLRDFADAVRAIYPQADIEIGPGIDYRNDVGYHFECIFDISRARQELGFEPKFDVRSGVADYVATMTRLGIAATYVP
jgi:UDP-glucose 4-epimerase